MVKDETRIRFGIRDESPCKGCAERFIACSDKCPKDERGEEGYKAWKTKIAEVEKKRKSYNNLNRRKRWEARTNSLKR